MMFANLQNRKPAAAVLKTDCEQAPLLYPFFLDND